MPSIELGNFVAESFSSKLNTLMVSTLFRMMASLAWKTPGYFSGLSSPSGTDKIMTFAPSPKSKSVGHKIAHIFDNDEVEVVQVERIDRAANHVAFKMARATRVDLHRSNALSANALRIDVARDIAFDNGRC